MHGSHLVKSKLSQNSFTTYSSAVSDHFPVILGCNLNQFRNQGIHFIYVNKAKLTWSNGAENRTS